MAATVEVVAACRRAMEESLVQGEALEAVFAAGYGPWETFGITAARLLFCGVKLKHGQVERLWLHSILDRSIHTIELVLTNGEVRGGVMMYRMCELRIQFASEGRIQVDFGNDAASAQDAHQRVLAKILTD